MCTLLSVFEDHSSRRFVFVEPGGNHGDYLIYRGAEKVAREAEIDFGGITHREFMNGSYDDETVIYLHGSGGYNPWWSGTPMKQLEKASQTHEGILIQGPSTVHADRDFIQEHIRALLEETTLDKIFFYTRERTSYDALKTALPEQVYLHTDHDTALHLEASDLPRADVRSRGHTFYAIRNDKESRAVARQRKPFRMWFDPVSFSSSLDEWVGHHARASAVVANRLHSAVVSTILGKPTVLLPNSYHKNRSVYEFSLADRGVEWREEIDTTSLDQFLSYLPARVTNSTRLASGLSKVRGLFRRKAAGSEIAGVTN